MIHITLIHPSRQRSEMASNAYKNWVSKHNSKILVQYILSVDQDDSELDKYFHLNSEKKDVCFHKQEILISKNNNAIEAINNAAKLAEGNIIIVMSDDFDCELNWNENIYNELADKKFYCAKTNDGIQPYIITLPILDKSFYNYFGYVYNPIYQHMYCDTEMTCVAFMLKAYVDLKDKITFKHNHYTIGASVKDCINEKNDLSFISGRTTFLSRIANNFGLKFDTFDISAIPYSFLRSI